MEQLFVALFGFVAIWLTQQGDEGLKKYACLFGLASQPFWFYITYNAQQWGVFALALAYTAIWFMGFYNYWLRGLKWNSIK